jgi:hypothetical protein
MCVALVVSASGDQFIVLCRVINAAAAVHAGSVVLSKNLDPNEKYDFGVVPPGCCALVSPLVTPKIELAKLSSNDAFCCGGGGGCIN